jgi:quercetin dioxygenase-like cupin family protein
MSATVSRVRIAQGLLTLALATAIVGCGTNAPKPQPESVSAHSSETLTPLFTQALPSVPGKTFTSAVVTFPPAAKAVPHRHGDAFVYAYVLEGAVSSQLEGEPAHVYHQGENWSEQPGAHHLATDNASQTEEAKLLVVFIADTGAQLKVDDPHS